MGIPLLYCNIELGGRTQDYYFIGSQWDGTPQGVPLYNGLEFPSTRSGDTLDDCLRSQKDSYVIDSFEVARRMLRVERSEIREQFAKAVAKLPRSDAK